jgi:hypothetical protein
MPDRQVIVANSNGVPLLVARRVVPRAELGAAVQEGCGRAFQAAKALGARPGHNVALYRDGKVTVDAGVECEGDWSAPPGLLRSTTPAGRVASLLHVGPYGTLGETHEALRAWFARTGERPQGPNWEVYGHWRVEWNDDPSRIETEVCYLLEG